MLLAMGRNDLVSDVLFGVQPNQERDQPVQGGSVELLDE